jgi:hypothetical protein
VPETPTPRLQLRRPLNDGSELVNVQTDLNQNADKIDLAVGYQVVTSTTRPSAPYPGKAITESDTSRTYFSNGTAPASGSWVEIPNGAGQFNNTLTMSTAGRLVLLNTSDVSLSSTSHAFQIGATAGAHLRMDNNEIMAANGGSISNLHVQPDGGDFTLFNNRSASSTVDTVTVKGNLIVGGIGQKLTAYKPSNETVTSSTALQDDNHLTVTLDANSVYRIYMLLIIGGISTGEIKTSWTVPASATGAKCCMGPGSDSTSRDAGTTTTMRYGVHTFTTAVNYGINDAANFVHAIEQGTVTTTTGGAFTLQWAQQASSATASTVALGSYLIAEKIA